MLGLVIAGRYARNVEYTNPGRSFNEILRANATVVIPPPAPRATPPLAPRPLPAQLPQAASFTQLD